MLSLGVLLVRLRIAALAAALIAVAFAPSLSHSEYVAHLDCEVCEQANEELADLPGWGPGHSTDLPRAFVGDPGSPPAPLPDVVLTPARAPPLFVFRLP